ncbi:Uncharacterised protein [Vibrio cholerae]|nr:Uncharacterised protein [Vibrio cholerae]
MSFMYPRSSSPIYSTGWLRMMLFTSISVALST